MLKYTCANFQTCAAVSFGYGGQNRFWFWHVYIVIIKFHWVFQPACDKPMQESKEEEEEEEQREEKREVPEIERNGKSHRGGGPGRGKRKQPFSSSASTCSEDSEKGSDWSYDIGQS